MKNISDIDANFKTCKELNKDGIRFYNIKEEPFKIYGVFYEKDKYRRIAEKIAEKISEGVLRLHDHCAGGRVRFVTDSSSVSIYVKLKNSFKMPHFALTGSAGFDLYDDNEYIGTFVPPFDVEDSYEGIVHFRKEGKHNVTINFPLYSGVEALYVGIAENATLEAPNPYKNSKPVVYYGSSITQGGCASRPGNCYQNIISRKFNCDYINLGFSGSAKAEDEMINYIKALDMSLFVYDYDHNAPTVEHLENTHEKMFKEIRKSNPNLPIIMMSRPKFNLTEEEQRRKDIIKATYENAISSGDKNVYFVDGAALTELCGKEGTVDGVHPNDFGFASMAKALERVMDICYSNKVK